MYRQISLQAGFVSLLIGRANIFWNMSFTVHTTALPASQDGTPAGTHPTIGGSKTSISCAAFCKGRGVRVLARRFRSECSRNCAQFLTLPTRSLPARGKQKIPKKLSPVDFSVDSRIKRMFPEELSFLESCVSLCLPLSSFFLFLYLSLSLTRAHILPTFNSSLLKKIYLCMGRQ